jgi:hypothetical protein
MSGIPRILLKHWYHSYEEDTEDIKIYRPAGYGFPPSRGRSSFEIKENGEFIRYGSGPTDMATSFKTKLKVKKDNNILRLIIEDLELPSLEIIEYNDNILKIKK